MWRRWGWWWLMKMVRQLKQRVLPLFLFTGDLDIVLEFYKPYILPVNVLPSIFSLLGHCLPPYDNVLFLAEPLDFLLDCCQLFLLCSFIFEVFIFPVFYLDLLKLDIALDDLYR
jgi:hypothetical protein